MRDEVVTYSMICRIIVLLYIPLCVACTVSFFFTGNLHGFVCSLLTIPLIMVPEWSAKLLHWKKSYQLNLIYYCMLVCCFSGGITFRLERWIPCYSTFCEIVFVFFALLIGRIIPNFLHNSRTPLSKKLVATFAALFAVFAGVVPVLVGIILGLLLHAGAISAIHVAINLSVVLLSVVVFSFLFSRFPNMRFVRFVLFAADRFIKLNCPLNSSTVTIVS